MKGDRGEVCNRTRCNGKMSYYYNSSTGKWYCQSCAFKINTANREQLCTISEDDRKAWKVAKHIRRANVSNNR